MTPETDELSTMPVAKLAKLAERKVTHLHKRPSPGGMVIWCKLDGFAMTLLEARQRLYLGLRMKNKLSN